MASFHAEKCCHLVSEYEASTRRLCSSVCQFLIFSTLVLVFSSGYTIFIRSKLSRNTASLPTPVRRPNSCSFYRAMLRRAPLCHSMSSVCLSVTFRYRDHIGWDTSKIISRLINLRFSLSLCSRGSPCDSMAFLF